MLGLCRLFLHSPVQGLIKLSRACHGYSLLVDPPAQVRCRAAAEAQGASRGQRHRAPGQARPVRRTLRVRRLQMLTSGRELLSRRSSARRR